jgi:Cdc6-like AAA superfamily ATPase
MALANQLGKNIFYFDEIPVSLPMRLDKKPDLTKAPKNLMFSSYVLYTNKSLRNLYGDSVRLIKKRVHFFLNNKRWYEDKGVPYTLGILLHGVPGAGKTSTIKSIAKDTNRHVLNIKLSPNTTVSQLNNLFYSSQVHIVQNGVNKVYDIPIDKRIIVIEDVDCLTDVVLERGSGIDTKTQKDIEPDTNANNNAFLQQFSMGAIGDTGDNEKLTLSTVLNILDGVLEQPGRIIIMTSNHPDKLDRALLRPGRIDVIVRFDFCKTHEMKEIVEAFIETVVPTEDVLKFVGGQYTPAEVTQIIFECIEDHKEMFKRLSTSKVVEIKNSPESAQEISLGIQVDERIEALDVEQVRLNVDDNVGELVSTDIIKNDIIPNSGVYTSLYHKTIYDRYDGRNELTPELVDGVLNQFQSCGVVAANSNVMDTNDLSSYFNHIGVDTPVDTQNKDEYIATQGDNADMMKNRQHMHQEIVDMYDHRNELTPALDEVLNEFESCGVVAGNSNNMMDLNDLSCCFEPIGLNFPPGI